MALKCGRRHPSKELCICMAAFGTAYWSTKGFRHADKHEWQRPYASRLLCTLAHGLTLLLL